MTKPTKCAPGKDSDQPGDPPSLIRIFTVCMKIGSVAIDKVHSKDFDGHSSLRLAHIILLVLSCGGSFAFKSLKFYMHNIDFLPSGCTNSRR